MRPLKTPAFVTPVAARVVARLPEGDEWTYEVKLDGYRALMLKNGDEVQIRSRNDRDLTKMYPSVAAAARRLKAEQAVVDGEIVAVDASGRPSFQALQYRGAHPGHQIVFYAFDLLYLAGADLRDQPLQERRSKLRALVRESGLLLSMELPGTAAQVIEAVRALGLEGVIAKRKDSRYAAGQSDSPWVKLKLDRQQEFVIGGYRPGPAGVDVLLVGYHDRKDLRFAGKVRAGFIPHVRRKMLTTLKPLHSAACPFTDLPTTNASRWGGGVTADEMHEMQWVRPSLVAQIRFVEWTPEGRLRHPAFLGLRTDKDASDVYRES